jgi:hypothetical protein
MAALGASAYFTIYSLDIRPYALAMLSVAVSLWAFMRWLTLRTRRLAVLYGLTLALMLYVHYYTVFLILAQGVVFLLYRPARQLTTQGLGALSLALALWLPWLPVFIGQILVVRTLAAQAGARAFAVGAPWHLVARSGCLTWQPTGCPGCAASSLRALVLWRKRPYAVTLLWALLVPAAILTANLFAAVYTPRYISYIAVGIAVAVGAALAALPSKVRYLAAAGFVGVNLWTLPSLLPARIPYRDLFLDVSARSRPGDTLYLSHALEGNPVFIWQYRHYLTPDLLTNTVRDLDEALKSRRIWFVTADVYHPEVRAAFEAVERTHPQQDVIGQCYSAWCYLIRLMEAPPLDQPATFEDNMAFWGVDVDSISREAITARLWWRVEATPSGEYSIGLYLLDVGGALAAQSDGPINNFGSEIVATNQLKPGAIYIDHRTLGLPPDLPAGEYRLALAVYRWTDGARLKLPDGSDLLALDTITLR